LGVKTFQKLGNWLANLRLVTFTFLMLGIVILKAGLAPIGSEYVGWLRETARNYPKPTSFLVSSPGPLSLMKLFNYPGDYFWWFLGLLMYGVWILLTVWLLKKRFPDHAKIAVTIFIITSPVTVAASFVGHIDIFTLLGCTLAGVAEFRGHAFIGAVLAVSGNADMAVATALLLGILSVAGISRARKIFINWTTVSLIEYGCLHLFVRIPSTENPIEIVTKSVWGIFTKSIGSFSLHTYALYGPIWLVLLFYVFPNLTSRRQQILCAIALIVFPLGMSILVLDGTRVGVTAGYICLILLLRHVYDAGAWENSPKIRREHLLALALVSIVLLPAINVGSFGTLRLPYQKIFDAFHPKGQ